MEGEICTDNRFEIIAAYKKKLIEGTNIQARPEEMAVIENILFRFWQMGWLPPIPHGRLIDADALENEAQMRLLQCNKYDNQFQKPYEVMRAIALAPTIIPAEEK